MNKEILKQRMNEMLDNVELSSNVPYYQVDHSHCWAKDNPPCGRTVTQHIVDGIERCCLCDLKKP